MAGLEGSKKITNCVYVSNNFCQVAFTWQIFFMLIRNKSIERKLH